MGTTRATSYRLNPGIKERLETRARAEGVSERALLERLVHEGLATSGHPGIVYRDGPKGRRAGLAAGPDVWEVISSLRYTQGTEEERIAQLADDFSLRVADVRTALDFAVAYRDEIDTRVAANDAAAQALREQSEQRAKLMAS